MAIKLENIRDLLMPGLKTVTGPYTRIPRAWEKIFKDFQEIIPPTTENADYLNGLAAAEDFINDSNK